MKITINHPHQDPTNPTKTVKATLSVSSDNKPVYMTAHETRCLAYELLAAATLIDNINSPVGKKKE